jgi:nicotinamidase-related amidase
MFGLEFGQIQSAALIVMHYQVDVFALLFGEQESPLLSRVNGLIEGWRETRQPVIFANMSLGKDYQYASPKNRLVETLKDTGLFRDGKAVAGLACLPGDPVYRCPRVNVFHNTTLAADLEEKGIDTLLLVGVASTGVVLSTVAWASDADYKIIVVRDCCYDPDLEAHEALFRTAFKARASIVNL